MPNKIQPLLLLVEDNADDAALAERALRISGIRAKLEVVESVDDAMRFLSQGPAEPPRAVFIDLNMPVKNGFDLLRMLRSTKGTQFLPAIVLTTSHDDGDIERCYKLGANGFVTKPIDFAEFTEVFAAMSRFWLQFNQSPLGR